MFDLMKECVQQIGKYALEQMSQSHQVSFKEDDKKLLSIVTEVDLKNSRVFREFANKHFKDLNYLIIDEESIDSLEGKLFEKIEESDYQFILDPIDGTINYSSGLPFWGVLLAVFKKGKPLYGFIYAPALDEFVYTNGKDVFREHNGKKEKIERPLPRISRVVLAHAWQMKLKENHMNGSLIVQDYFSAVIYFLYLSLGQIKAALCCANLWDIAPFMVLAPILGMGVYDYETRQAVEITEKYFLQTGRLKKMTFMGYQDEFEEVKNIFL